MRQPLLSALAISLALTGCGGDPAGPPPRFDLAVETDQPEYSLATDSVARVTLTNRSDRAVYLPMDSYVVYERLRDGEWQDAFAWFVVDGVGRSFPLDAGRAQTDELQLWFYLPERSGTYRFRYFVYADPTCGRSFRSRSASHRRSASPPDGGGRTPEVLRAATGITAVQVSTLRASSDMRRRNAGLLVICLLAACDRTAASDSTSAAADADRVAARTALTAACPVSDSAVFAGTELADRDWWYGTQLRAMGERGLCANAAPIAERYRLVLIPTFHPSISVRAARDASGPRLDAKVLTGAGGYDPGTLHRDTSILLSVAEWTELVRLIEAARFWEGPPDGPPDGMIGLDGARWIVEGVREGRYNLVDRWSPRPDGPYGPHRMVGEWLLRRSGLASEDLVRVY